MQDQEFQRRVERGLAVARGQYATVVFPTANVDVEVRHQLRPAVADLVRYTVVNNAAAAVIYHDQSATRRPWATDGILLRASAPTTARLLLFLEPEAWS